MMCGLLDVNEAVSLQQGTRLAAKLSHCRTGHVASVIIIAQFIGGSRRQVRCQAASISTRYEFDSSTVFSRLWSLKSVL